METRMILLALSSLQGLGPNKFHALLDALGSAEAIWNATHDQWLQIPGIGVSLAGRMGQLRERFDPAALHSQLTAQQLQAVVLSDPHYPEFLRQSLGRKAPLALYYRGQLPASRGVAIVGTRSPSRRGREQAASFARALAQRGVPIISGLAHGIDTCAHQGALRGRGITAAVLGTPLDNLYPRENIPLADRMRERGAVMTEYPVGSPVHPGCFPWRNRIIVGLAAAVLVVESGVPSGALNTATWAAELNVDLCVIPGNIDDPKRRGNHQLLKEGAILVESPQNVMELIGLDLAAHPEQETLDIGTMLAAGMTPGQIVERTGRPVQEVLQEVTRLQLEGF